MRVTGRGQVRVSRIADLSRSSEKSVASSTGQANNMRAAVVHVVADAAVSVLVIGGLLLARFLGWTWMDPLAAIVGSVVIES